jgi:hypothetical protein
VKQEKRKYLDYFIQTSRGEEVRDNSLLLALPSCRVHVRSYYYNKETRTYENFTK